MEDVCGRGEKKDKGEIGQVVSLGGGLLCQIYALEITESVVTFRLGQSGSGGRSGTSGAGLWGSEIDLWGRSVFRFWSSCGCRHYCDISFFLLLLFLCFEGIAPFGC